MQKEERLTPSSLLSFTLPLPLPPSGGTPRGNERVMHHYAAALNSIPIYDHAASLLPPHPPHPYLPLYPSTARPHLLPPAIPLPSYSAPPLNTTPPMLAIS